MRRISASDGRTPPVQLVLSGKCVHKLQQGESRSLVDVERASEDARPCVFGVSGDAANLSSASTPFPSFSASTSKKSPSIIPFCFALTTSRAPSLMMLCQVSRTTDPTQYSCTSTFRINIGLGVGVISAVNPFWPQQLCGKFNWRMARERAHNAEVFLQGISAGIDSRTIYPSRA